MNTSSHQRFKAIVFESKEAVALWQKSDRASVDFRRLIENVRRVRDAFAENVDQGSLGLVVDAHARDHDLQWVARAERDMSMAVADAVVHRSDAMVAMATTIFDEWQAGEKLLSTFGRTRRRLGAVLGEHDYVYKFIIDHPDLLPEDRLQTLITRQAGNYAQFLGLLARSQRTMSHTLKNTLVEELDGATATVAKDPSDADEAKKYCLRITDEVLQANALEEGDLQHVRRALQDFLATCEIATREVRT